MILLLISLLAGVLTVLAPCTISLLPVIVGGSLAGGTSIRRTVVVTLSLGVSVILFTLLLKVSSAFIQVPQSFWEIFSGIIIIFLGLTMLFPSLWDKLPYINKLSLGSNKLIATGYMKQNTLGDILVGASLGPVFSSCSPTYFLIIATVLPRSIFAGLIYLFAYTIGLCVTLLIVAIAGQKILNRLGAASDPRSIFKRAIGVLFLVIGVLITLGLEAKIELAFANSPLFSRLATLEQKFLASSGTDNGNGTYASGIPTVGADATSTEARIAAKAAVYPRSAEITNPSGFINTDGSPITIKGLEGKVVLVDFWDYSCINCQREIPYVEAWYKKYSSQGLVVIGVHTPEFAFEKLKSNVEAAAQSMGMTFPIVLDNDYSTWNAFNNQFWPQVYLIDSDGFIVYSHSGEGNYDVTESAIQKALKERSTNQSLGIDIPTGTVNPSDTSEVDPSGLGSPETYFGYNRNQYLGNGKVGSASDQTLVVPANIAPNKLYLGGLWKFAAEYASTADAGKAKIVYKFTAKNAYLVATGNPSARVKVLLDGAPVGKNAGADVAADGSMTIKDDRLYKLISLPNYGTHTLEIDIESGSLDAYTFTFG